ncbi:MAG: TIGR01906 family membrane protein [Dehalococcoidia bacterium]
MQESLRVALALGSILAVLAIPVLLTTSSLRFAINAGALYEYDFDQYDISLRTGIPRPELTRIGAEIRDYFNNDEEFIDPRATIYGEERQLFTQREIIHMKDVKGLVRGVYLLQWISLGYLLGYAALYATLRRGAALPLLARRALWGGGGTLVAILAIGLVSLVGFDALFLKFHQIGFSNDFWQLDPRVHKLIAMFPQSFFLDATIFVALMTIGQALLLVTAGGGYLWLRRRGRERARRKSEEGASLLESQASLP